MFSARGLALKMFPISRLPVKPFRHCHTDIAESAVMTKRMFMREFFARFAASFIAGGMLSFTIFRYVGINDHRSEEHYRVACNKIDDLADKMISTQLQDVRILNDAVYRICGVPMSVVIASNRVGRNLYYICKLPEIAYESDADVPRSTQALQQ